MCGVTSAWSQAQAFTRSGGIGLLEKYGNRRSRKAALRGERSCLGRFGRYQLDRVKALPSLGAQEVPSGDPELAHLPEIGRAAVRPETEAHHLSELQELADFAQVLTVADIAAPELNSKHW